MDIDLLHPEPAAEKRMHKLKSRSGERLAAQRAAFLPEEESDSQPVNQKKEAAELRAQLDSELLRRVGILLYAKNKGCRFLADTFANLRHFFHISAMFFRYISSKRYL